MFMLVGEDNFVELLTIDFANNQWTRKESVNEFYGLIWYDDTLNYFSASTYAIYHTAYQDWYLFGRASYILDSSMFLFFELAVVINTEYNRLNVFWQTEVD